MRGHLHSPGARLVAMAVVRDIISSASLECWPSQRSPMQMACPCISAPSTAGHGVSTWHASGKLASVTVFSRMGASAQHVGGVLGREGGEGRGGKGHAHRVAVAGKIAQQPALAAGTWNTNRRTFPHCDDNIAIPWYQFDFANSQMAFTVSWAWAHRFATRRQPEPAG